MIQENLLPTLLSHKNAALASGLVCKRGHPYPQVGFLKDDEGFYLPIKLDPLSGRAYKTDVCAFGCTLVDLRWIQKLEKPYFRDEVVINAKGEKANLRSDVILCERFKELGAEIIIDTRTHIGHICKPLVVWPNNRELLSKLETVLEDEK